MNDDLTPSGERAVRLAIEVAALRAKVARVEALAAAWRDWRTWEGSAGARIRAALASPTPDPTEGR